MAITAELLGTLGGKGYYGNREDYQEGASLNVFEKVNMTVEKGEAVVPPGTYWVVITATRTGSLTFTIRCNGRTVLLNMSGMATVIAEEMVFTAPWTPEVEFSSSASSPANRRIRDVTLSVIPI